MSTRSALVNANRATVLVKGRNELHLKFNNDAELRQAYAELDALAQQAPPPSDHDEVWAQIEATLQGVIDDGTNAEIDELDAELLLGLVRSRGAPAPTGQQAERPAGSREIPDN